ncbi:MAG: HD-GYP domain-containing protein [Bacillota bacterium]
MFSSISYHNDLAFIHQLLFGTSIRNSDITDLENTSGIHIQEAARLLSEIRDYHIGVYRHSINVGYLTAQLAFRMGLSKMDIYTITIGALFHDIGKTMIPHSVLDKPSKLSKEEWELIKEHPKVGVSLISKYHWGQQLEPMILLHHERLDGNGYYSVASEEIPLSARMVSIADAFDAMKSTRPYQRPRSTRECWAEIKRCCGTQFAPELLPSFRTILNKNNVIPGQP